MAVLHTYKVKDGTETEHITRSQAIRLKCMDCAGDQRREIRECTVKTCALYPFRMGNVNRS